MGGRSPVGLARLTDEATLFRVVLVLKGRRAKLFWMAALLPLLLKSSFLI